MAIRKSLTKDSTLMAMRCVPMPISSGSRRNSSTTSKAGPFAPTRASSAAPTITAAAMVPLEVISCRTPLRSVRLMTAGSS